MLSKKRFKEVQDMLGAYISNTELDVVMKQFCEIMHFDPEASTYNQDKKEQIMKSRRKRAEELGVSIYVTSGNKSSYHKRKEKQMVSI
jgi:hypothetical protein